MNINVQSVVTKRKGLVKVNTEKKTETKKWTKKEVFAVIALIILMLLAGVKSNEDLQMEQKMEQTHNNYIEDMKNVDK